MVDNLVALFALCVKEDSIADQAVTIVATQNNDFGIVKGRYDWIASLCQLAGRYLDKSPHGRTILRSLKEARCSNV